MIITYNGIVFDDVVEGDVARGLSSWTQVCEVHEEQISNTCYLPVFPEDIASEGHICGVQNCEKIASHYIAFPMVAKDKLDKIRLNISINRKDLIDQGYNPDFLTDEAMVNIANSVERAIKDTVLPTILEAAIDAMDIPKKEV